MIMCQTAWTLDFPNEYFIKMINEHWNISIRRFDRILANLSRT